MAEPIFSPRLFHEFASNSWRNQKISVFNESSSMSRFKLRIFTPTRPLMTYAYVPYLAYPSMALDSSAFRGEAYVLDDAECDSCPYSVDFYTESSRSPYHLFPEIGLEMNSKEFSTSVVSANFGAELLLKFQLNAMEKRLSLNSIDSIYLTKNKYEELEKILEGLNAFKIIHNFSIETRITEYIIQNELMIVLATRGGNEKSRQYSIERGIMLTEHFSIFKPFLVEMPKEPKVSWVTSIKDERPNITTLPIKAPGTYNPLAYPGIGVGLDDFINGYVESTSNILLLYSPPGTGKTSLLKHLLETTRESCLITYSEEIKNMDSLFAYFLTSKEKFLIIEDADNYLTARSKDANNHSMKKLLNITDGLTSNPEKKVIFTTNLPTLDNVDDALLRPGRCYKALYFPYLKLDEAIAFLESENNGVLPELFQKKEHKNSEYSLASLHSYLAGYDPDSIVDVGKKKKFGFN